MAAFLGIMIWKKSIKEKDHGRVSKNVDRIQVYTSGVQSEWKIMIICEVNCTPSFTAYHLAPDLDVHVLGLEHLEDHPGPVWGDRI